MLVPYSTHQNWQWYNLNDYLGNVSSVKARPTAGSIASLIPNSPLPFLDRKKEVGKEEGGGLGWAVTEKFLFLEEMVYFILLI